MLSLFAEKRVRRKRDKNICVMAGHVARISLRRYVVDFGYFRSGRYQSTWKTEISIRIKFKILELAGFCSFFLHKMPILHH